MNVTVNNANTAYAHAEDLTSTAIEGKYYKFAIADGAFSNQGMAMSSSDDLVSVLVPIEEGDIVVNNTEITWSGATSAGLMKSEGDIRIKQIKPSGTPSELVKIADITHYMVTAEDIAAGADTLAVVYRISTQTDPFFIKRIRA